MRKDDKKYFGNVRRAEERYARALRSVARHIGEIVRHMTPNDPTQTSELRATLKRYAEVLKPWARTVAAKMVAEVTRRDEAAWNKMSKEMARQLRQEVKTAPTGKMLVGMLQENVDLITSLPVKAAERVHELSLRALETSTRAKEIAKEIAKTGKVIISRANLIARTEVARTASGLVEARALHVGSEGYIWRTAGDADVRPLHRKLNGTFHRWDEPPISGSDGERAHAGQIYNCRCYPEPVIPEEL